MSLRTITAHHQHFWCHCAEDVLGVVVDGAEGEAIITDGTCDSRVADLVRAKAKYTWDDYVRRSFSAVLALVKWLLFGLGPLASICVHVALFFRSDDQE